MSWNKTSLLCAGVALALLAGCSRPSSQADVPVLSWYVFDEPSGSFEQAASVCSQQAAGQYRIEIVLLPVDADQQREQLARRLAASDPAIDLIGMDVIWTAEFAAARWIAPWSEAQAASMTGRLESALDSARWDGTLWAAPFTTNAQMLWYRADRIASAPQTWAEMLAVADGLGPQGTIEAQGARYEGLTVFFITLLRSAGTSVLDDSGTSIVLEEDATLAALELMRRFANSESAAAGLANAREDDARLGFEAGQSSFMLNYSYVWPSARANVPAIADDMRWARLPRVDDERPSRVTLGGINIGVGAFSEHREAAFDAALCLSSADNQRYAARVGGLPPTIESLYDDRQVRETFPFADTLRATLEDAVQRPKTPLYSDVSLAIGQSIHPLHEIEPEATLEKLREALGRALRSEGLL